MDDRERVTPLELPPYPYDRLDDARRVASERFGRAIDLSIGTPHDPPAGFILEALADSRAERSYPPSIGSVPFRTAASAWMEKLCGVTVDPAHVGATIGLKELVAGLPHWLRLRRPDLDTVLYPAVSYPSYDMGAQLAGGRGVPVPVDDGWRLRLDLVDDTDVRRALCLWVNSPGNPAGGLDDLDAVARWGRANSVPVFSDECYIEFTWDGPPRTILETGTDGVVAVHSLSKRSSLAGVRAGFYAGDPELVRWLQQVRIHSGFMMPGPSQAAAVAALSDQAHVEVQRDRYLGRMTSMCDVLNEIGLSATMPRGSFYLWVPSPAGDAWALTERLADEVGIVVSPGEFYGEAGSGHVRVAVVCSDADIDEIRSRV